MKLETFFEKFELFADAPDAVAKMRELVLELAVRGRLVPNIPDETAVSCEAIKDASAINTDVVPANWRVVLLADAIKNRSGNSKLIKGKLHDEPAPGRFQGFSASGADVWCDDYEHEGQAIIISAVGARCGKAFKASGKWSAIANTNIARPDPSLFDFDFAYLVLNNEHFWIRGGSAQPFVKFPPSLDRHFAIPPLAEQKRIVAKVDELMALCDRLEAQQQERKTRHAALVRASLARFTEAPTPANLEFLFHPSYEVSPADLRKTILTLAVQGKLVPQDPNDEPAAQLLKRILAEKKRRTGRSERFDEEAGLSPNDEPFEIPENWEWIYATTPAIMVSDQGKKIQTKDILEFGKYPVVDQGKMFIRGYCDDPEKVIRIDGPIVLFGDHTRETKFIDFDFVVGADGVKLLQPICIDPRYYFWVLRSLPLESRGYARHFKLLKTSRIPLPPLAEQKRIVAKVDQLMALVNELEQQLAACRTIAEKLLTALVAELANGKNAHASAEV